MTFPNTPWVTISVYACIAGACITGVSSFAAIPPETGCTSSPLFSSEASPVSAASDASMADYDTPLFPREHTLAAIKKDAEALLANMELSPPPDTLPQKNRLWLRFALLFETENFSPQIQCGFSETVSSLQDLINRIDQYSYQI